MAFVNRLLQTWQRGQPTFGGWLSTSDVLVAQYLAAAGFDEICVDQQHGSVDPASIGPVFAAIEAMGVAPTTRVASLDPAAIGKSLDMGAVGVIVPMINTRAEAAALVAACRYPPAGTRSIGPTRAIFTIGLDLADLARVAAIAMIETAAGLANVDEIARTPGLDALYIGPGDLAIGLGIPVVPADRSADEARVLAEAVERIRVAAEQAGIVVGMYVGSGAESRRLAARGFRMLTVAWDAGLLEDGGRAELGIARGA